MKLTVGPVQFFWDATTWMRFYQRLAEAPVENVVVGELVCSKRLPFYRDRIPEAIELLRRAGKSVSLTSLALVTLNRERAQTADLFDAGAEVEINDLTALAYVPEGVAFSVGPMVNVYNEGTLAWLARRGARRVCLPPELPLESVRILAAAGARLGVEIEVWAHGRVPLAIAGRCYHARLHGRGKDNCQFVCAEDPDGLPVDTRDGEPFLAINGVQTLSASYATAADQYDTLREEGVASLRLSPHTGDFAGLCTHWRDTIENRSSPDQLVQALSAALPGKALSDGFLVGTRGVDWSRRGTTR